MLRRRRFKQTPSLKERLGSFVNDLRKRADKLPPGPARDQSPATLHESGGVRQDRPQEVGR